jgi:hypothetical protein
MTSQRDWQRLQLLVGAFDRLAERVVAGLGVVTELFVSGSAGGSEQLAALIEQGRAASNTISRRVISCCRNSSMGIPFRRIAAKCNSDGIRSGR